MSIVEQNEKRIKSKKKRKEKKHKKKKQSWENNDKMRNDRNF